MGHLSRERSPRLGREARGFRFQALEGLGLVDDEPRMCAGAYSLQIVLHRGLEKDLASFDGRHHDGDLDRHAQQRRCEVFDRDLHPDGILAGVGMGDDELAASVLDVEDHGGGAVGARLFPHEADRAVPVERKAVDPGYARLQACLHCVFSHPAVIARKFIQGNDQGND